MKTLRRIPDGGSDFISAILFRVFVFSFLLFGKEMAARAAGTALISERDSAVPYSTGGDSDSECPWVSADGRYVLFCSEANDLVTNGSPLWHLDVFLRDRASNTMTLISESLQHIEGNNDSPTRVCFDQWPLCAF
jgi:hypothetical protein